MMRVVHVSYHYDPMISREEDLLERHATVTGWAEALQRLGAEVIVVNRFGKNGLLEVNGVKHYFIKDELPAKISGRDMPDLFLQKIAATDPDIVHLHDLSLVRQTKRLRRYLNRKCAIVLQHHGGPPPGLLRKLFYAHINRLADGYFFTAKELGKEWFSSKSSLSKVMPIMEGSGFFNFNNRDQSRQYSRGDNSSYRLATGVEGDPAFLWVGRLDENKDPMTVLEAFQQFSTANPFAKLYMIYSENKLRTILQSRLDKTSALKDKVYMIGKIEHGDLFHWYHAVDFFILGSHYEGSGYALSEALSCGCIPIVTDIPSFRMMTNQGKIGALWEAGNPGSCVVAIKKAVEKPRKEEVNHCIEYFKQELSFDAIAKKAIEYYLQLINKRNA